MIFIIFKGFPERRKIWIFFTFIFQKSKILQFLMTADQLRKPIFATFPILHISHPNEWIFIFELSCGHLVMIFIILKCFPESQKKINVFNHPGPVEKWSILLFSHYCTFLLQISKILQLSCSVVNWWWFSSFLKAFQKVEKLQVFKNILSLIPSFWIFFHPNEYI